MQRVTQVFMVWCVALFACSSARAADVPEPPAEARPVLADCSARGHRQALVRHHDRRALDTAYRYLAKVGLQRQPCGNAIASQRALRARVGTRSARAVIRDCITHGRLTRAYSRTTLRAADRMLSTPQRLRTQCALSIVSQRNGLRRAGSRAVVPPAVKNPAAPTLDEPALLARLAEVAAVFARPAGDADRLTPELLGLSRRFTDEHPHTPIDAQQARRIGPASSSMFVIPGRRRLCQGIQVTADAAGFGCDAGDGRETFHGGIVTTPSGLHIWGFVPDAVRDLRVLTANGRWRPLTPVANGVDASVGGRVPRIVAWTRPDGLEDYWDLSTVLCLGDRRCPASPSTGPAG